MVPAGLFHIPRMMFKYWSSWWSHQFLSYGVSVYSVVSCQVLRQAPQKESASPIHSRFKKNHICGQFLLLKHLLDKYSRHHWKTYYMVLLLLQFHHFVHSACHWVAYTRKTLVWICIKSPDTPSFSDWFVSCSVLFHALLEFHSFISQLHFLALHILNITTMEPRIIWERVGLVDHIDSHSNEESIRHKAQLESQSLAGVSHRGIQLPRVPWNRLPLNVDCIASIN